MFTIRILACVALLAWLGDLSYRAWSRMLDGAALTGGATYPVWVATAAFVLLAAHLGANVLAMRRQAVTAVLLPPGGQAATRFVLFVLVWIAYVLALPQAGFMLSTALALAVGITLLDRIPFYKSAIAAVIFVVILKVLFITVFYISLPEGFIDRQVTEIVFRLTS